MTKPADLDSTTIIVDRDGHTATSFVRDLTRDMDGPTLLKLVDFMTHTMPAVTARSTIKAFMTLHDIPRG